MLGNKPIKELSVQEKQDCIQKINEVFDSLVAFTNDLRNEIQSDDLNLQAWALWTSGQFCRWYDDFKKQLCDLEKQLPYIEQQMKESGVLDGK